MKKKKLKSSKDSYIPLIENNEVEILNVEFIEIIEEKIEVIEVEYFDIVYVIEEVVIVEDAIIIGDVIIIGDAIIEDAIAMELITD